MTQNYIDMIRTRVPNAVAEVEGSAQYPDLRARTAFYQIDGGVLVCTYAENLPMQDESSFGVFATHIHFGESCTGNAEDPFADAKTHYNPTDKQHPYHAGDMPPLFSNYGEAFSAFLTDRFRVRDVIGKTVIIHAMPDDFMTQPSGNSGGKIACGIIKHFR